MRITRCRRSNQPNASKLSHKGSTICIKCLGVIQFPHSAANMDVLSEVNPHTASEKHMTVRENFRREHMHIASPILYMLVSGFITIWPVCRRLHGCSSWGQTEHCQPIFHHYFSAWQCRQCKWELSTVGYQAAFCLSGPLMLPSLFTIIVHLISIFYASNWSVIGVFWS